MTVLQGHIAKQEQGAPTDNEKAVAITVAVEGNESFEMLVDAATAARFIPGTAVHIRVEPVTR